MIDLGLVEHIVDPAFGNQGRDAAPLGRHVDEAKPVWEEGFAELTTEEVVDLFHERGGDAVPFTDYPRSPPPPAEAIGAPCDVPLPGAAVGAPRCGGRARLGLLGHPRRGAAARRRGWASTPTRCWPSSASSPAHRRAAGPPIVA